MGLFRDISKDDLLYQGKRYKPRSKPLKHSRTGTAERSISKKRPDTINSCLNSGHWEIDTVKSGKNTSFECLLTLTERMTRFEIIIKLANGKAATVVEALNKLERKFSPAIFKNLFKSITADNGSEFMDFEGLEYSKDKTYKRLDLYFVHPYRACESGTNENHNGIIRRFFKKGTDFSQRSDDQIKDVQIWMNNYPRRILKGYTPHLEFCKIMGDDFLFAKKQSY